MLRAAKKHTNKNCHYRTIPFKYLILFKYSTLILSILSCVQTLRFTLCTLFS